VAGIFRRERVKGNRLITPHGVWYSLVDQELSGTLFHANGFARGGPPGRGTAPAPRGRPASTAIRTTPCNPTPGRRRRSEPPATKGSCPTRPVAGSSARRFGARGTNTCPRPPAKPSSRHLRSYWPTHSRLGTKQDHLLP
jgi:hypothetical protein